MSLFVLLHGAADSGWSWHLVASALSADGHEAVAPDLPADDDDATLDDYADAVMAAPWPLAAWPDIPTRVVVCADDRFFPAAFLREVARERLGVEADEIPGSHCETLSSPGEMARLLEGYAHSVHAA